MALITHLRDNFAVEPCCNKPRGAAAEVLDASASLLALQWINREREINRTSPLAPHRTSRRNAVDIAMVGAPVQGLRAAQGN